MDPLSGLIAERAGDLVVPPVPAACEAAAGEAAGAAAGTGKPGELRRHRRQSSVAELPEEFVSHVVDGSERQSRRGSIVSQSDVALKGAWVERQLKAREAEFTREAEVTVCAATFNVNGRKPIDDDFRPVNVDAWLTADLPAGAAPDVYAIGFQELDLSKETFLLNNSKHEEIWSPCIENALAKKGDYVKLHSKQLVGMLLMLYVKRALVAHITDVASASEGTGILGVMGNKGGVSIRFKLHASTFCFVCAHLAAHNKNVKRRNADHADIMSNTVLTLPSGREFAIADHDAVVFVGDLNYRIPHLELPDVVDMLAAGQLGALLEVEQLGSEMRAGNVFVGFEEPPITFWPTYKFEPGTDDWETRKLRTPAWCDRVLYRGAKLDPLQYSSHPVLRLSDHKPVRCVLKAVISTVDQEKYSDVLQQVHRKLDALENQSMPDASVSTNQIDLGPMRYGQRAKAAVTLTNTGQVMTQFRFVPKPGDAAATPPWLAVLPPAGILAPGECVEIVFAARVNHRTAGPLNRGECALDDIVVLHLENGKDIFVSVTAKWVPSFMGESLAKLVDVARVGGGGGDDDGDGAGAAGRGGGGGGAPPFPVPRQLWAIVDHLCEHGLGDPNLFSDSSGTGEDVVRHLDNGERISADCDPFEVAAVLIAWLRSLPESVIPETMFDDCMDASPSYAACRRLVHGVEPLRQQVFLYLVAFLRHSVQSSAAESLAEEAERHRDEVRERLALTFGKLLLRAPGSAGDGGAGGAGGVPAKVDLAIAKKQALFVDHFLSNADVAAED